MDTAQDFLLLRFVQSHSMAGGVLSPSTSSARLWVTSSKLSPCAIPLQAKKLLVETKMKGLIPSWTWLPYLLSASIPDTLGVAWSTTCWAQCSGDVPGGGGQPEEVSQLLFKQSLLKTGHGGLCLLLPRRFCGSSGGQRAWCWEDKYSSVCCTPSLQNTPHRVCVQRNAHTCF